MAIHPTGCLMSRRRIRSKVHLLVWGKRDVLAKGYAPTKRRSVSFYSRGDKLNLSGAGSEA